MKTRIFFITCLFTAVFVMSGCFNNAGYTPSPTASPTEGPEIPYYSPNEPRMTPTPAPQVQGQAQGGAYIPTPRPVRNLSPQQVFADNVDAVFMVETYDRNGRYTGSGSGFFINSSGVAVTNHHVIVGEHRVMVITEDGNEYEVTGYYYFDINNDLAVIQVDGKGTEFAYLDIGDSDAVQVGETVYAIGSPDGDHNTFSISYVSRIAPSISFGIYTIADMIQITAPIYPGSSGGALLNAHGQVVGVTSAVNRQRPTVAFVVPISRINFGSIVSGQVLSFPLGASAQAPGLGNVVGYERFPFIPDFAAVSPNTTLILGGTARDMDFDVGDEYEFDYVYFYELAFRHFVPDTDKYDELLAENGFVMQDIIIYEETAQVFLYNPARDVSLLYVYLAEIEALLVAVGQGDAYTALHGAAGNITHDFVGYQHFPYIPDFSAYSGGATLLEMGRARDFGIETFHLLNNLYIVGGDMVYLYDLPIMFAEEWVNYEFYLYSMGFEEIRDTFYEHANSYATLILSPCERVYISLIYDLDDETLLIAIG